jgi:nicotinamide riboside kinase
MRPPGRSPLLICVTGAECTGKTTLATTLAEALGMPLVPEVARNYLAGRSGYDRQDVLAIAREQQAAEQEALQESAVVVADTDLTVIQVWWEEKYGELDPWLIEALARRTDRRYLLTVPDLPWERDPLRESPHDRDRLHQRYLQVLGSSPFPYVEVTGLGEERSIPALEQAEAWLGEWRATTSSTSDAESQKKSTTATRPR